jgi:hypothetical protein
MSGGIFRQPVGKFRRAVGIFASPAEDSPVRRKFRQPGGVFGAPPENPLVHWKVRQPAGILAGPPEDSATRRNLRWLGGKVASSPELSPARRSFRRVAGIFGESSEDSPAGRNFRSFAGRFLSSSRWIAPPGAMHSLRAPVRTVPSGTTACSPTVSTWGGNGAPPPLFSKAALREARGWPHTSPDEGVAIRSVPVPRSSPQVETVGLHAIVPEGTAKPFLRPAMFSADFIAATCHFG